MKRSETCATCRAMTSPDFVGQSPEHAVELGHIAGMAIGVALVGGYSVKAARERARQWLCEEHAADLFRAAGYFSYAVGREPPS